MSVISQGKILNQYNILQINKINKTKTKFEVSIPFQKRSKG